MKTVLVTGSRKFVDYASIYGPLLDLRDKGYGVLVHGDCVGADQIAVRAAKNLNLEIHAVPAKWTWYGSPAGPIRNRAMLHLYRIDLVLAFPLPSSKGTWDMVNAAKDAGVKVEVFK